MGALSEEGRREGNCRVSAPLRNLVYFTCSFQMQISKGEKAALIFPDNEILSFSVRFLRTRSLRGLRLSSNILSQFFSFRSFKKLIFFFQPISPKRVKLEVLINIENSIRKIIYR